MPPINRRKMHHDLNIPLSSSSLSSKRKVQEANQYQNRLSKLGYSEIAFIHTSYGRLKLDKDDADYTLPWKDLIPESSISSASGDNIPGSSGEHNKRIRRSIGQINTQLDIKVYRRLNIIVEEVSDVSRILLPNNDNNSSSDAISKLLQKYDIISLQPMNELALQNICELMATSTSQSSSGDTSNNNTHFIDIIVLEYATGSRGGHGLPYKLRKDYLVKALSAGITFEVCYGTAILDPKRRQGFIRTLLDFQTTFNSIQKKHMLLNKHSNQQMKCKSNKFPLLLSSGSRQNYTLGTSDEGVMTFRKMDDVNCLVSTLLGGDSTSWFDSAGLFDMEVDDGVNDSKKHKKKRVVMTAADRVLTRASDRALGVVSSSQSGKKRKQRSWDSRSHIVAANRMKQGGGENDGSDDDCFSPYSGGATSLVDWLSESSRQKKVKEEVVLNQKEEKEIVVPPLDRLNKDGSCEPTNSADRGTATSVPQEKINYSEEEEDKDDIEDGYIAL